MNMIVTYHRHPSFIHCESGEPRAELREEQEDEMLHSPPLRQELAAGASMPSAAGKTVTTRGLKPLATAWYPRLSEPSRPHGLQPEICLTQEPHLCGRSNERQTARYERL